MKTKFVTVIAIVAFSFSALANRTAREIPESTKKKMEELKKVDQNKANEEISSNLLAEVLDGKTDIAKLNAGLDILFKKEELVEKLNFAGHLKTLKESTDPAIKKTGGHMESLIARLSDMKDADVQEIVVRMLKNTDVSLTEVSEGYENQLKAISILTYKKYVRNEAIDSKTIELTGIANLMKADLGLKADEKSGLILSLKDISAENLKKIEDKLADWKAKCKA